MPGTKASQSGPASPTPAPVPFRDALQWLVCPACRAPLELIEAHGYPVRCSGCARSYPVVDGLPVLLVERAKLAPDI